MKAPTFSLIVPTLNRTDELQILLNSLRAQEFKDFEVLIIDQNSDNRVIPIVDQFSETLIIRHFRQIEKGASKARNVGLVHAKGNILTFPDDDCEYPHDLLQNILNIFLSESSIDGLTCSSRDKNSKGRIARMSSKGGVIKKLNVLPRTIEFTIFVKSSKIKNLLFDENLGVGSIMPWWSDEGPDFVLRLIYEGARFVYFPDIVIFHPNPVKIFNEASFERSYRYGLGRGGFLKKHKYAFWYVLYIWSLYFGGIIIGCIQFDKGKIKYYYFGLNGRIKGFINSSWKNIQ